MFLDFDGVLADMEHEHDAAQLRAGNAAALEVLVGQLGRLALVSGRPLDYLVEEVPASIDIFGLYGIEWRVDGLRDFHADAHRWRAIIEQLVRDGLEQFGPNAVEAKGVSLTVHYRFEPQRRAELEEWVNNAAKSTGLDARDARMSFELHPPIDIDKGTVVRDLGEGFDSVAYFGDDLGDLAAFDGLDDLTESGQTTFRVAVTSPEAPPLLIERSDLVLDGPAEVEKILSHWASHLGTG